MSSSQLTKSYFSEGLKPPTRNGSKWLLVFWTMSKVRHKTWLLPNDSLEKLWTHPMFYYNWTLRQITGWWFGTWLLFSIYWECHHPNWRNHIFQRDWNRQPEMDLNGYLVIWTMSKVRHKTWLLPNDSLEKWWKPPMFYYNWTLRQITGWWFGTWLLWLSIILGMSSSQLTNSYFSEG